MADIEWRKCRKSPHYFLKKYAWIINRNTAQTVKWEAWDYQFDLLDALLGHTEIVILKARQLGISWLLAGYCLWKALFSESAKILFLSQGEDEAWDMVAKAKFIWEGLPDFLRIKLRHDTRGFIDFAPNNSEIKALPSTDRAGRSTDATIVVRDELARHPYGKENFVAISPTIDAGGQLIDLSTIDKTDIYNHFTERVNRALSGESGAHFVFLPWRLRPTRREGMTLDQWFEQEIRPKYEPFEIEQEYPETLEEALSAPKIICRFDTEAVAELKQYCDGPQAIERNGLVKIYKQPIGGRKYIFAIDSSEGDYDPSLGQIIDARNLVKVAEYYGKIPLDEQAVIAYDLYERYYKPYTAVERNASGLALIRTLKDLGVTNWHYYDKQKEKEGWWTSSASRPLMITDLAEAIRLREITEPNEQGLNEFLSFIRTDKKPEGEARGGAHDEYVMAWGIALQIRKHIPMGEIGCQSFDYKESI